MLLEIKTGVRTNPTGRGMVPRIMVLQCDVCKQPYERPYSKHHFEEKIHRCSQKCMYGTRSTDVKQERIEKPCDTCGKALKRLKWFETNAGKHWFCNKKCYGTWRATHPEVWEASMKAMQASEIIKKRTENRSANIASGKTKHARLGTHHSEEAKQKQRDAHAANPRVGAKNGMFGRKHSIEACERMSDMHTQRMIDKRTRPYGKNSYKGSFVSKTQNTYAYKSSWEHAMMVWLDKNEAVMTWDYECLRISYVMNNNKRWYVPDFMITFSDDHRELWEIKPKEFINSEKNVLKTDAANAWCAENDVMLYRVLTGDDLREMNVI